ncbi:MAG: glycosyltransferase [Isosphaeraceae bacterium]
MIPPESLPLPRVLMPIQLDPSLKFGSLEEQVVQLSVAFRSGGGLCLPVYTRALGPAAAEAYEHAGVEARALDLSRFSWTRARQLRQLIEDESIELVNWNFYPPIRNPYLAALRVLAPRIRHVYTDHISRPSGSAAQASKMRTWLKRRLLRPYLTTLCVSDFVRNYVESQGVWPRVARITHFVNVDRFAPNPAVRDRVRRELGAEANFVTLVIAHLIPEKGVHHAVEAIAAPPPHVAPGSLETVPSVRRWPSWPAERHPTRAFGSWDCSRMWNRFSRPATAFCAPQPGLRRRGSLTSSARHWPTGRRERHRGIPEFVHHEVNGLLVRPGDSTAIVAALSRLATESELHERLLRGTSRGDREGTRPRRSYLPTSTSSATFMRWTGIPDRAILDLAGLSG